MFFFSYLPQENWNDMFGFVPRPQLAELVPDIGDWHFAAKAQYYLHECGKITLGKLRIEPSTFEDEDGLIIVVKEWESPIADVPIPENIINFKGIDIRFVVSFLWLRVI
jgi:hypothetical protein